MIKLPTTLEIEIEALRCGLSMGQVCKQAGVNLHVWRRWKSERSQPSFGSVTKIVAVLNELSTPG